MRTADKHVAHSQQGSMYLWGVCVVFCDLKCYECFKLLFNLVLKHIGFAVGSPLLTCPTEEVVGWTSGKMTE